MLPTVHSTTYLPPQALALEAAVLGSALQDAAAAGLLLGQLSEAAFYSPAHGLVFGAMRALAAVSQPIDVLTVTQRLKADGTLQRAGGGLFVGELATKIDSASHLDGHCRVLLEYQARRTVIVAGRRLEQHGHDEGRDPVELIYEAQTTLNALHHALDQRPARTVADHFDAVFTKMAHDVTQKGLTGVDTGLLKVNDATGGWQPGDLIVLAARPAMGKTAVMLHAARAAGLDGQKHVAIFSLEMPAAQLVQRLVASEVEGYSNADLRHGRLPGGAAEVEQVRLKAQRLKTLGHRLHVDDTAGLSIHQVRAKCARLHAEHPLGLVLVDYIQLMRGDQKGRGNREQEISSISRGLKELAKELNVPVIALSQLSRDVEKRGGEKRPQLSDLRESGAIEQDADMIVFLWRGEYYKIDEYADGSPTAGTLLLDIAKHRNGNVGELIVGCRLSRGLLFDLADGGELPAQAPDGFKPLPASSSFPREDDNDLPF